MTQSNPKPTPIPDIFFVLCLFAVLAGPMLAALVGLEVLRSSIKENEKAFQQAHAAHEQMWEERIAAASSPQEAHILKTIRQEARGDCHPSYDSDRQEMKGHSDPANIQALIARQEAHCLEVMMGRAYIQKDPDHLLLILEDLLQNTGVYAN